MPFATVYCKSDTCFYFIEALTDKRLPRVSIGIKRPRGLSKLNKIYSVVLNDLRGQEEDSYDLKVMCLRVKLTGGRIVIG